MYVYMMYNLHVCMYNVLNHVYTCACVHICADMGFGVEFSRHKRQSQGSGAVLGSTDVSGNSSSRESTPGEEEGNGTGLGCFYRAIYSFPGTNEDEVCTVHGVL